MTSHGNDRPPTAGPTPEGGEESFVARWLRRKRAAREGRSSTGDVTRGTPPTDETAEEPHDEAADVELPPVESLDEASNYADFLSPRVSETLRRQALRKLFMSAKFNITDGLDDYAEDYRTFHALGDIITSDMRYAMKREAEKTRMRSDSAGSEQKAERAAETQAGDEPDPGAASAGDPDTEQRAASEQREGGQGDETGSA